VILTSLIGQESATAQSREHEVSRNPSDGSELFTFAHASLADVDDAVANARRGMDMPEWRDITPDHRGRLLWRVSTLIEEHADELALMDANDAGMPLAMSRGVNVPLAAQVFRYYAGFATKIEGRLSQVSIPNTLHYTTREPIGVCALITPWNVPLAIAAWKLAPALATGNTAILKPAEQAVWSTWRLVEICREAGIPGEVVQVLLGGPEIGQALVRHRGVDKVSFTGSTEVGCQIVADVAPTLKRVSLELGGKAPSIVTASADMDQAILGNLRGALFNSGQACGAYTRTFVHRSRADEFAERIAEAAKQMRVGHAMNEDTELGPLITRGQVDRVLSYIEGARAEGADLVYGGRILAGDGLELGHFLEPTVLTNVEDHMRIAQEEVFGPVISILPFDDEDEAIARANASDYGLAAVVWTKDLVLAHTMAKRLRAGTVFVNLLPLIDPGAPWGGFGLSGWGREMGAFAIDEFTEPKGVFIGLES
jgi:acyl-CoA reductase-like NAD-dependent aldehyde dehydrogenase